MCYRDLVKGDLIQIGDEWFNPDWELGGPWFSVKSENKFIDKPYNPESMRPMRRPLN